MMKFRNPFSLNLDSYYFQLFRYFLPAYKIIHSLIFLFSSLISLNLFVFDCNQLAIILFGTIWFLNMQYSTEDKNKLINEIMNNQAKRKIYQEEIIRIVQSRYLLANDSVSNYEWLNFIIKTKWTKHIQKIFQYEINLIAYSNFVDEKFSLKDNVTLFRNWTKLNEILINKDTYRFDSLMLKETKPPVLHEITKGNSLRKDEIVFQLKVQFWIDIIIHDLVKDEKKVIEDLEFLGSARLTFLPLLKKYPFIGGFVFHFYEKLIACFNSSNSLLNSRDAQSKLLKQFIHQKVNQILHNQIYKIRGRFIEEIVYQKTIFHGPILLCHINIIEILNLDSSLISSNFTYFCLVQVGEIIHQTKSIKNTISPKFNETITFPVHDLYEMIRIKLYARKHDNENSTCIGQIKIDLPTKDAAEDQLDNYLRAVFKKSSTFAGKQFWLPLKSKSHTIRLPFINMRIALMQLTTECCKLVDPLMDRNFGRNLDQSTIKNEPNLPVIGLSVTLTNIQLDYLTTKYLEPNKLNKDQTFRIIAIFNGTHQYGQYFFVKSSSLGSKLRDANFFFIENSVRTTNELTFEIELLNLNRLKETLPGRVTIKLNDLVLNRKSTLIKSITFQSQKLNKANPLVIGTAELYLTMQTVLIQQNVLDNLLQSKQDKTTEYLKPQNYNSIGYFSSYSEKLKRLSVDKDINEFVPDLQFKSKKKKKITKESSKQPTDRKEEDKDECEILLAFHYPLEQLLLVDIIRLINVPVFSRNALPNPTLLIEIWKDKSRIAHSLTETKYQTRDPFYSIQVQFEISANKLANLFLRILILEDTKKNFLINEKPQFLAESFIKIPELEIGNSSEPNWFKFTRIGIY